MAPQTGTALLVLVGFVLPGFVTLLIAERTFEVSRSRDAFELLLLTAYYSIVSYVIVGLVTWPFHLSRATLRRWYHGESLGRLAALGAFAILVVPALVATAARIWQASGLRASALSRLGVHRSHRVWSGWDEFFRRREPALVRMVLSNGRVVAGVYGPKSFAGYGEQAGDLLLEQAWELDTDDWFAKPRDRTTGLWLPAGSIVSMELYDVEHVEPGEGAGTSAAEGAGKDREGAQAAGADVRDAEAAP